MKRIALDAMGGDYAPAEVIKGALQAAKLLPNDKIILVGKRDLLKRFVKKLDKKGQLADRLEYVDAEENIEMSEHPVEAIRSKKKCSINIGMRLVREQKADAFISAGNTGAVMASALFTLGRIKNAERPAIASFLPSMKGDVVLLDMGANSDNKPQHLVQFAKMGQAYSKAVMGVANPEVGLLNIGEENEKGSEFTIATNKLLRNDKKINFGGNVEGKDILMHKADVVVTDGFTGNVVLKLLEGVMSFFKRIIKKEMRWNPLVLIGAIILGLGLKKVFKKLDYKERGGAQLLGVKGVCMITHGRAKAKTIKNAILKSKETCDHNLIENITAALA